MPHLLVSAVVVVSAVVAVVSAVVAALEDLIITDVAAAAVQLQMCSLALSVDFEYISYKHCHMSLSCEK